MIQAIGGDMPSKILNAVKTNPARQGRVREPKGVRILKADSANGPRAQDQYFSRAVGKALEVLELLQMEPAPLHMNDIVRRLQVSKTSGFRLLRTLETLGCITMDGRGKYALAPGIHAVTPTQWLGKLHRAAMPHIHSLSRELSETASLAALFENRVEVIAVIESPHVIRMSNEVGHILPPNASSLGKIITAFQSPEVREKLLRSFGIYRFTDHTITDEMDLVAEYEVICKQGFAVDREECAPDGICFSAPIVGPNATVPAAISLSMPKMRLRGPEHEKTIIAGVRAKARQIALELQSS
jgi:DNA-binding IclR family transcriptional regulator